MGNTTASTTSHSTALLDSLALINLPKDYVEWLSLAGGQFQRYALSDYERNVMKSITEKFTMLLAILLLSAVVSRAEGWRGIIPLKSTRADVERLLGKPNNLGRYQFENERAYIHYATGSCNISDRCECFVPKDKVIEIYVELEVELRFSSLNLDRATFQKTIYPEDSNLAVYSNDEAGIIYAVSERDDDVTTIQYLPSAKDCEEVLKRKRLTQRRA